MAAPNIVNVTTITGITTAIGLTTTTPVTFLSNASSSNKVFKINSLMAVNTDGVANVDVTIRYHTSAAGAGSSVPIATTITVPADASLVILGKDNPIYLEENRSLTAQATVADDAAIICSYEDIS